MTRQGHELLIVLGEGGHTTECLNLVDQLSSDHTLHYVVTKEDEISTGRIRREGVVHKVRRPNAKDSSRAAAVVATMVASAQALLLVGRVRPSAVVSSGPAVGVPVAVMSKLLGAEVIYVETIARVKTLSMTGRLMRQLADLYFIQWPELDQHVPDARNAGRLL